MREKPTDLHGEEAESKIKPDGTVSRFTALSTKSGQNPGRAEQLQECAPQNICRLRGLVSDRDQAVLH